uniref:FeS cluster biogenesis domain-containing protein n=1 Tax=Mus spicilegus TaxID=10103 RepID=A0A8C6HKS9_MUSSI
MSASLVHATMRAVSKRKLQPTRAASPIKQLLKDKPEHVGLKVGVRTRGCNGLCYSLEYTKTKEILMKKLFKMESECSSRRKRN